MKKLPEELQKKISLRKENNALRTLSVDHASTDFSSNDYLGFSKLKSIHEKAIKNLQQEKFINGSTGSRLVSGTHLLHSKVENQLAEFHQSESALLFNSGYDANLGLFSSILQKGDTVLYDELIHASIRDGIRLSNAKSYKFKHNSLPDLKKKFSKSEGTIYIVVEAVYSMDGDTAPLEKIVEFSKENNCYTIIDEAHSNGVFGENGKGLVQELKLEKDVFARVHTFGKALGCHGAVVMGSKELREYLINFSRSFIYTTAASLHAISVIKVAYETIEGTDAIQKLKENIQYFNKTVKTYNLEAAFIKSNSAIHCCIISGNDNVKNIATKIQEKGFDVKPILSPTIQKGEERLRICLHSYNTFDEIFSLLTQLAYLIHL